MRRDGNEFGKTENRYQVFAKSGVAARGRLKFFNLLFTWL